MVYFPQVSHQKPRIQLSSSHMRYMLRPSNSSLFDHPKMLGEQYRSLSSSLCIMFIRISKNIAVPNLWRRLNRGDVDIIMIIRGTNFSHSKEIRTGFDKHSSSYEPVPRAALPPDLKRPLLEAITYLTLVSGLRIRGKCIQFSTCIYFINFTNLHLRTLLSVYCH